MEQGKCVSKKNRKEVGKCVCKKGPIELDKKVRRNVARS